MAVYINTYVELLLYTGGEGGEGGLYSQLVSGRSGVGERWYVSCFQHAFLIFSNR